MIAGTVPYQHAGTPAWLIPARLPLWYMEAIVSMYTILASIGCGPHVSSSCGEEDTCASSYVTSTATCEGASGTSSSKCTFIHDFLQFTAPLALGLGLLANHGAELLYRNYCAPYTARVITLLK